MEPFTAGRPDSHTPLDVIVIGEALTDVVTTPSGVVEHPGGSPANVAYGLGRLGVPTGLLTAIGEDARGAAIETHLHRAGVRLLPGSRSLARTSSATATLTADGSASYDFDVAWDLPGNISALVPRVLHTGSIATFLAPGARTVKTLVQQAHQRCTVTYDPNIRPALLGSHTEARTIFKDFVPATDLVKLSDEDAQWLYPRKTVAETAAHVLGLGAKLAVVTMGAKGSLLASAETSVNIPAVKTGVADTIGAGDSYMSALILAFLRRATDGFAPAVMARMGRMAAAAAAITVSRAGANPPSLEELDGALRPGH
ncbi:carbohydrate kinase family protein [Paenarthrobacter nitroguajacolicus]|uniref:carbohydrate kinase family protein n=1 Tax=Paenarthrobacter nitroguajacolicus TaxID=211146 RepID=UPI00248AB88A|nr:carbohydrate kinase [Paenarthrobacter nitroguajacolicus]MDI2035602.1 ATP-dependent 6-phosphofructokinase [Paenarthrobacter nitroguajacolicus]